MLVTRIFLIWISSWWLRYYWKSSYDRHEQTRKPRDAQFMSNITVRTKWTVSTSRRRAEATLCRAAKAGSASLRRVGRCLGIGRCIGRGSSAVPSGRFRVSGGHHALFWHLPPAVEQYPMPCIHVEFTFQNFTQLILIRWNFLFSLEFISDPCGIASAINYSMNSNLIFVDSIINSKRKAFGKKSMIFFKMNAMYSGK